MKLRSFLLAIVGLIGLLAVGVVNALGSRASDVSAPVATPKADLVEYHVVGDSMAPTINDGDWLLARKNFKKLTPGLIVIMRYPKDETKVYVRRIEAVTGDRVVMKYYSNVKLTTVYSSPNPKGVVFPLSPAPQGNAFGEYDATVTAGNLYVVGDNTAPGGSFDSDEWGLLPISDVIGVVEKRISPQPTNF